MAIDSISTAGMSQARGSSTAATSTPARPEQMTMPQDAQAAQSVPASEQILPPGNTPDRDAVDQAVSNMNTFVQNLQRDLQFEVDLDLGQTVISVVDRSTNEVIRQIPSEEAVARAQRLREQFEDAGGLLIKVQA